jgi:hypothetical protein
MNARTAELRQLMRTHQLTAREAGKLIGRTAQTVRNWRCRTDDARTIPEHTLAVLKQRIAEREGVAA